MTHKEALTIAWQDYEETGEKQAIIQLARPWHERPTYCPIELRWASGLRGEIVAVIGDKPKGER